MPKPPPNDRIKSFENPVGVTVSLAAMPKNPDQNVLFVNPTKQLYDTLQKAYAHYNKTLFGGELPQCVITLNNKGKKSYGYYVHGKFASNGDGKLFSDEICLNPVHFQTKDFQETMQTLVHEMVHLWQHHKGKKPARAYHDKQFAEKMFSIGLQPTANGTPTGAITGQHMMDISIPEGPFDVQTKRLVGQGLALDWYDRTYTIAQVVKPKPEAAGHEGESEEDDTPEPPKKTTSKIPYSCPDGHINAWAKPGAKLLCGECSKQLVRRG